MSVVSPAPFVIGSGIYPAEILNDVFDVIMENVILEEGLDEHRDSALFLDTLIDHDHVMAKGEPAPHDEDALNAIVAAICHAATFRGWFGKDDAEFCIGSIEKRGYRIVRLSVHEVEVARQDLARAREDLAAAVARQDPERHFKGLRESEAVIAAYDRVRAAEKAVARLEKEGRRA